MEGKKVRTFLACDACRKSKLRCIAAENPVTQSISANPVCQRCSKLNIECQYTPKRSQLKKKLKQSPSSTTVADNDFFFNTIHNLNRQFRKKPHALDSIILPNKQLLSQIINQFFQNQYHSNFSFINKKQYIDWILSDKFEDEFFNYDDPSNVPVFTPCTLLAILALVARHNTDLCKMYGNFDQKVDPQRFIPDFQKLNSSNCSAGNDSNSCSNASRYFAYYSRLLLKDVFDTPSVQRIQSLTLLSSHEWSEGNFARSYLYIGIAARMCSILGLFSPRGVCYQNDESFIMCESKRRTVWSVYMMDRCNSSGHNRSHALKIEDIEIPLPCPELNFQNGIEIKFPSYNDCFKHFNELTSLDFTIITFELWSKIAKWIGDIGAKNSKLNPMDPNSDFNKIYSDLNLLKEKLPAGLNLTNLDFELNKGNLNIGYLYQLLYLCEIFLTREYFYYNATITQTEHLNFTNSLKSSLKKLNELNKKLIESNNFIFTPFTFFQIFTTCVTCLSISSILHDDELIIIALNNMEFLKSKSWNDQLISMWLKICQQLQDYLSITNNSNLNLNLSSDKFKNLLNDFGESDIKERISINEPLQKTKKLDLHDILNSSTSSTTSSSPNTITTPNSITSQASTITSPLMDSNVDTLSNTSDESFRLENARDSSVDHNKYVEIDKYFKNWEKIIPNWNDVFIEFDETNNGLVDM